MSDSSTSSPKAIETTYHGCRFRSRLEARWAVFFDTIGIEWEYEPQGFVLGESGCYLPDFYFPKSGAYAEVKPDLGSTCPDWNKAFVFGRQQKVYIIVLVGPPNFDWRNMRQFVFDGVESDALLFPCLGGYWPAAWLVKASEAATSARFEFGESGTR